MLNYISAFGRDAEFTVDYGGGISKNKIRLTVPGNPVDPFSLTENASDEEQGLANILLRIGQRPRMSSRNNACLRTRRGALKRRRQLYEANYPIERIRLVDEYDADDERSMEDNNSSSFNFRFISHTTRVSKHGLGLAVDINTLYNPYTKTVDGERIVEPVTGEPYLDREADFPYKIDHDDLCFKLFTEHGFEWGGDWEDRKDYQHFEIPTSLIEEWYPSNK